jgi:hypothetical protein
MALPWLLRPYKWQTHFIPFLPPSFADFLSAPVPFIAGVLAAPLAGYDDGVAVLRVAEDRVSPAATPEEQNAIAPHTATNTTRGSTTE